MNSTNQTFYDLIPPIRSIKEITNLEHYYDVPADWHIALTDVQGSTEAIENGKYKDVNAIAAASITAMLNHVPDIDIPFVFGGDGATIVIPPTIVKEAGESLAATKKLAQEQFGLRLRIGIVPIKDVLQDGYRVRVGRLHMSDNFQQAIFMGGGLAYAERLVKDPMRGKPYAIKEDGDYHADFSGFECRWNQIPSSYEETLSLMVLGLPEDIGERNLVYRDVLLKLEDIYGDSATRHPIRVENMTVALNPSSFNTEARIRHQDASWKRRLKMLYYTFGANLYMIFNVKGWGAYKGVVAAATDNEKFDDTLRMIISGTTGQRAKLRGYLEAQREQKKLVYGMHASSHAMMTCVVFDRFGRQVHFVDGANGGYALAAREMKEQLKP